jgi:glutamine synthetase
MISKKLKSLKEKNIELLIGIELEFYLEDKNFPILNLQTEDFAIKKEVGEGQFEAVFHLNSNVFQVLKSAILFRNRYIKILNFKGYAFTSEPNSGMQFNFSLWKNGENMMENDDFRNRIIFSLLKFLPESLNDFVKNENCILRLTDSEKIKKFRNSPCNISCGGQSNRTTAIRLIDERSEKYLLWGKSVKGYRIEHRVPSSSASVLKSFTAILKAILHGIEIPISPENVEILHSNAFEEEIISAFNLTPFYL